MRQKMKVSYRNPDCDFEKSQPWQHSLSSQLSPPLGLQLWLEATGPLLEQEFVHKSEEISGWSQAN
jgi:hypothetical protein